MVDLTTGEILESDTVPVTAVPFLRTAYNYDRDIASVVSGLDCPEPTLTQQQFKDEVDINTLVERFGITGELPQNVRTPLDVDFAEVFDFRTAMDVVLNAEKAFAEMPADVRKRFDNDPALFMQFVHDDKNRDEAVKLGLVVPPRVDEPIKVRVIPDPEAPPKA